MTLRDWINGPISKGATAEVEKLLARLRLCVDALEAVKVRGAHAPECGMWGGTDPCDCFRSKVLLALADVEE